jgi:DNA-binding NarL/FixJ family response regulator
MIRVLLADDQALVRGALAAMLALEPDIEVVAQVGSGDEVLEAARRALPDVALIDVQMPGKDGLAATAELRAALPSCRVVICTTFRTLHLSSGTVRNHLSAAIGKTGASTRAEAALTAERHGWL